MRRICTKIRSNFDRKVRNDDVCSTILNGSGGTFGANEFDFLPKCEIKWNKISKDG